MADSALPPSDLRSALPDEHRPEPGEPSFEVALERLEAIVGRLEEGDMALEDALAGFEEGVRLSRRLADRLADAERRIERLVREGGGLAVQPLEAPATDPDHDPSGGREAPEA